MSSRPDGDRDPAAHVSESPDELFDELTPGELVVRSFSVAPFLAIGIIGAIGCVASVTLVIFGVGANVDAVWTRMNGRSFGGVLAVMLEAVVFTLLPIGLVALAVAATDEGLKRRQRAWFWPLVIAVAVLLAAAVAVIELVHGSWLGGKTTGLPDWAVLEFFAAFTVTVTWVRWRRQRRDIG